MAHGTYKQEIGATGESRKGEEVLQKVSRNTHSDNLRIERVKRILGQFSVKSDPAQAGNKNRHRGT
jgi:hypothetical protein